MKTRMKAIIKKLKLSLIFFILMSCSEVKNLHEMKDSTKNMEKTTARMAEVTEQMAKTTSDMAQTTTQMAKTTEGMSNKFDLQLAETYTLSGRTKAMSMTSDELYDALRQATGLQVRNEVWKNMLEAPTMYRKMVEAGKYFMAFEMQLWNQFGQDGTQAKRDSLAQQATKEFFFQIEELAKRDGSLDLTAEPKPTDIHSESNRMSAFNAVALALNQVNRKQLEFLGAMKKPSAVISMHSLILEALEAKSTVENLEYDKLGSKLPFIREILVHEDRAVQLLRAQVNLAPLVFIDSITKLSEKNIFAKGKMLLSWELDLASVKSNDLEYYYQELVEPALRSKALLKKLGYDDKLVYPAKQMLGAMNVKHGAEVTVKRTNLQNRMVLALQEFEK